jgi:polyisoprenyl-phosphate glycosyltransferase
MKKFSIIVPVYFNEPNLPFLLERLSALQGKLPGYTLEMIFVDDGSRDKSFEILAHAQQNDPRIKVIKLSKNFGSMSALQAGLMFVTGDCAGIIAADLQDPPELFQEMLNKWENGSKVIMAQRQDRKDSFFQKLCSKIYYCLLRTFALPGYPTGGFDFVLIDRQVVNELNTVAEKNTNIMNLIYWLGHSRDCVTYVRQEREHGISKWTWAKKLKLFIDSFVNFSYIPIRLISIIGLITAMLSFALGCYVLFLWFFADIPVKGWATLVALITMLLGLIMVMLGIIGEYLWRILDECRKRPSFVIDRVLMDETSTRDSKTGVPHA